MTSEEFEQQVARITSVIEGDGAVVSWDAQMPDPDNPDQLRQIDVSIRRGESLSIVECRLHSRPQDVKWVEELYGRRVSLRAQAAMGVSASGFTAGAWRKGAALGIFLRELHQLSDFEARSWGRSTKVRLSYIHLKHLSLFLIPSNIVRIVRPNPRTLFLKGNGESWPLDNLLHLLADRLAEDLLPEGIARLQVFPKDLHIGTIPVPEVVVQAIWRWVHRDLHLPAVLAFQGPGEKAETSEALIEKNHYSRTEVFHVQDGVFPVVDVSLAPVEPRSYLRRVDIDLGQPLPLRGVGMIGLGESQTSLFHIKTHVYRRDSPEYRLLLEDKSPPLSE